MERIDCVVIGAGVVGLAVGRALAEAGREVLVLDRDDRIGAETSSRNSEVIHAGIYYPTGSLKALACVEGKQALYRYCQQRGIPHARLGKLIVATAEDQLPTLRRLQQQAAVNGVPDLTWLSTDELRQWEPNLTAVGALHSPSSGIIDSHALMVALQGDLEAAGGMVVLRTPVVGGAVRDDGIELHTGGAEPLHLVARTVVNAAGLHATALAAAVAGMPAAHIPAIRFAKGNYFRLQGKSPFRRLVYPVPEVGGLGVHITLDLAGQARFGPDVEWIDAIDYRVDPARAEPFYAAVRRYWPALPDGALLPDYAGVRIKLLTPDGSAHDFRIDGPSVHGVAGLVHLFGIESPGLTSCLALARRVAALVGEESP
ncbi:MAG: NAD(P)/FAD-dependent oxidoreductase [Alphaproteobacteria bacterium]|nr:NAD(P)/FAD-dependent oxidoreductase [Alphaproteobacteria bacterium]